jgi:hypothetical protein
MRLVELLDRVLTDGVASPMVVQFKDIFLRRF